MISMNILGYLSSLCPNLVAVGGGDSTQQHSAPFPSLTDIPVHRSGYRTVPYNCVCLYKMEPTAALFPCLVKMPNYSLSHRKKMGGKKETISDCRVFPCDTFSNFVSGLTV